MDGKRNRRRQNGIYVYIVEWREAEMDRAAVDARSAMAERMMEEVEMDGWKKHE